MADLRTTQLAELTISGTAITNIYTVPAGKRAILKSMNIMEVSGVGSDVQIRVGSIQTIVRTHVNAYGGAGDSAQLFFWLVLNAGETLSVKRISSGDINVVASGSVHTV